MLPAEIQTIRNVNQANKLADAGRAYLQSCNFQLTRTDVNEGLLDCIGHFALASKVDTYTPSAEGAEMFGGGLLEAILQFIASPNWHTPKLLRLAINTLVKREQYLTQCLATPIQKNDFFGKSTESIKTEQALKTWRNLFRDDGVGFTGLGVTGLGCLEALRAISNVGVHFSTLLFDLCHILVKVEAAGTPADNEQRLSFWRAVPGESLPYKAKFSETSKEVRLSNIDGTKEIALTERFGSQLRMTCKPERMQWLCDNNQFPHYLVHLKVIDFNLGYHESYSSIGQNQLFAIEGDEISAIPLPVVDITDENSFENTEAEINLLRTGTDSRPSEATKDGTQQCLGNGRLSYHPKTKSGGIYKGCPSSTFLSMSLEKSIFDQFIESIKSDRISNVRISAFFQIDSGYTTSSRYETAADFIFHDVREAKLEINGFAIEYKLD